MAREQPLEWSIDGLVLGQLNLLVGRNATGKSRTLNVIGCLANILSNAPQGSSRWQFRCHVQQLTDSRCDVLEADGEKVTKEQVFTGDDKKAKLDRTDASPKPVF